MTVSLQVPEVTNSRLPHLRDGMRPPRAWQLTVVREMLATLETLTAAGQQHIMEKIAVVVRDQVRRAAPYLSRHDQERMGRQLDELVGEADRFSPDATLFTRRAEAVLESLARVG